MTTLGKKQRISNDAWLEAMEHIEELVSREEIDELAAQTVAEIKETVGDKKAAYAWSGGKGSNIYTDGKGVTRYSPLADWKHEHILAYIHYNDIPLPPIYGWKNGYTCGTHPWPARQWTGSIENGWQEIYDIDPSIVTAAAEKIESARHFLEKGGDKA